MCPVACRFVLVLVGLAAVVACGGGGNLCHVSLVHANDVVEFDHAVRFEAAHVLMSGHTARTQELGAVRAASHGLLLGLAACAIQLHLLYGQHVKDVVHDVVVLQTVHTVTSVNLGIV